MTISADSPNLGKNYTLVLKIGTSTLMADNNGSPAFCLSNIGKFVDTVCLLKSMGHKVVVISSGAVGAGVVAMHLREKPKTPVEKQAVAAVGQCRLMRLYEDLFSVREERVAQLLITRTDFVDKAKYLSFRNAILELLKSNVIPIINENDAVASERFRFGDNDTFASHCAASIAAHWVFILSDIDCLCTANPRTHPTAKPIPYVDNLAAVYKLLDDEENSGTTWGTGGMISKIAAIKIATTMGIHTAIINGMHPGRILSILSYAENHSDDTEYKLLPLISSVSFNVTSNGTNPSSIDPVVAANYVSVCPRPAPPFGTSTDDDSQGVQVVDSLANMPYLGTIFVAHENKYCPQSMGDHRRWILSLPIRGNISLDMGAVRALLVGRKSLFAAGVIDVKGKFNAGDCISIHMEGAFADDEADEIARCIVNFNSKELSKIKGMKSERFKEVLGTECESEVANRSNIIFMRPWLSEGRYRDVFVEKIITEETRRTRSSVLAIVDDDEEEQDEGEESVQNSNKNLKPCACTHRND